VLLVILSFAHQNYREAVTGNAPCYGRVCSVVVVVDDETGGGGVVVVVVCSVVVVLVT
jgi:hypothetical protein